METLVLLVLILLNGLFSMPELALATARRPRLARLSEDGDESSAIALQLGEQPTRPRPGFSVARTECGPDTLMLRGLGELRPDFANSTRLRASAPLSANNYSLRMNTSRRSAGR